MHELEFWAAADDRLNRQFAITKTLRTPVNFIVHTLQEVNEGLSQGRYFFMDVVHDGIALYQTGGAEFHEPTPMTPVQALAMAREYFNEWFPSASVFLEPAGGLMEKERTKEAAFIMHQAAERFYHCL